MSSCTPHHHNPGTADDPLSPSFKTRLFRIVQIYIVYELMRPRTPSIGSKSSQPAKGPRTCGTSWSAPLQDSLNPQPDSSLKFGNVWHVIPVPPCHNLDKDSANKEGQMTSLQVHIHFDPPPNNASPHRSFSVK